MSAPVHWLVRIAERAGLGREVKLDVPPDAPIRDAWPVVARGYGISDDELSTHVADYYRLKRANMDAADPNASLAIPEALARKHNIFPLVQEDRHLIVATSDPTDVDMERAVGFSTGRTAILHIASPKAIEEALDGRFAPERQVESILGSLEDDLAGVDSVSLVEDSGPEEVQQNEADATPVVRLTNLIISDGIGQGASDIHIEPGRKGGTVRYRVDGVLRKHMDLPMSAVNRVISRIKILGKMDIADRLRPQDGKARVRIRNLHYDLRVSTLPAAGSEKCVIRILDSSAALTLDDLGLPDRELERMRSLLTYRDGIVVITGPTGSGKTTTLYGALREMADGKTNIMTVEDPIEYDLPAITQTQVESKQGVTFGSALRAILRQDPDVILVGEIRDRETADVAAQAAMTGHLVLATVHANDAVSAVGRLADMGLPYPTIAQTLRGALAQRLLRRVCPDCAEPVTGELTPEEQGLTERHGVRPAVRAVGCQECGFTGYRGRLPIVEVLVAGPRFETAVEQRKGHATLSRVAQQGGMRTMQEVALEAASEGKTTLVEVERVLGQVVEEEAPEERTGPPRALVVDDDADARLLVRNLLEGDGYLVEEANDGHAALDILKADPEYSLVILDLLMPGMNGRELLNHIRGSVDTAAVPVLIRTGTGTEKDEVDLLNAGADDFVPKAADSTRLMARVRAVMRRAV
jgi:type II secretory ATPase GspE/PulE/Tfp pilus assembly ATPase PilB-like protein/ActR/RegA family two-component response regulator